jgi:UDP-glucose 4-epimerase
MRTAILGANGYIGKHLAHFLQGKGWEVSGYGRAAAPVLPGIRYTTLDVREAAEFEKLDTDVDAVFYFPGMTGTARGYDEYETYIDVNEKGLLHLLDRLRRTNRPIRVVYPSTRLVYKGVRNTPLREEATKEFKTLYALNKWFGECALHQYKEYFNIPFTIFRICVPYANLFEGAYSYGTVGFFLGRAAGGHHIGLYGDGNQKRTFTHVEDICGQIYQGLQHPQSLNNIYNIAGETFSLKEVAEAIARKFSVQTELRPWPEMDEKLESGDTIFDPARIRQLIDYPLKHSFATWLESLR